MALNEKQKRFCQEYIIDLNATQAYIRAGYSENGAHVSACQLLSNPKVQEEVNELIKEREKRTEISADYVLKGIKELTERCIQATPVLIDGQASGEYKFEANSALKGYELLGKHLKLFTDKAEITGKDGAPLTALSESDRAILDHYMKTKGTK